MSFIETIEYIFKALGIWLSQGKNEAVKFVNEKLLPAFGKYFKLLAAIFLFASIPTIAAIIFYLVMIGPSEGLARTVLVWGGIWNLLWFTAFMVMATPISLTYDIMAGGIKGSVQRNISRIESFFMAKLLFVVILYFTPMHNNVSHVTMFIFLSCAVSYAVVRFFGNRFVVATICLALLFLVSSFVLPGLHASILNEIKKANSRFVKPTPILPVSANECRTKIEFFWPDGTARSGYYTEGGRIIAFEVDFQKGKRMIDTNSGKELLPINQEIREKFCLQVEYERGLADKKPEETPERPPESGGNGDKKEILPDEAVSKDPPREKEPHPGREPEKPGIYPYLANHNFINHPGTKEVAIVIIDERSKAILSDGQKVASDLKSKEINATASLLNNQFISSGTFEKIWNGNSSEVTRLNLSQHIDYLVLGKRSVKYGQDEILKSGAYTAEITVEIVIVSTKTGMVASRFVSKGQGIGYSREKAEQGAISSVCRNLASDITKHII